MMSQKRLILSILFAQLVAFAGVAHAVDAGKLAVANGDVRISGKLAKPGDGVKNEDTISTGESSSAKILFSDQSVMDLGANSSMKVSDYALKDGDNRTGTFSLIYGKLRALVTKKVGDQGNVQVRSGSAVMGVRGTEFVVDTPKGPPGTIPTPTLVVVNGLVAVRPLTGGPSVAVGAGQMLVASKASLQQAAAVASGGASGKSDSKSSDGKGSDSGKGGDTAKSGDSGKGAETAKSGDTGKGSDGGKGGETLRGGVVSAAASAGGSTLQSSGLRQVLRLTRGAQAQFKE
jgi:hypothetical protein